MIMRASINELETDEEGFLLNPDDWNMEIANAIARQEKIEMTSEHWVTVGFIRAYFNERQVVPENRTLLKFLKEKLGSEKGTRKYVHTLFPYGYGQQACKIAGMRKPRKLMLDV